LAVISVILFGTREDPGQQTFARRDPGLPVAVIDAGHGGIDGGASTSSGVTESGINLSIAKKLDLMLRLCGYDTLMLRREDISLHGPDARTVREMKASDLKNRAEAANAVDRGILISIHQNKFPQKQYYGAQVFYTAHPESEPLARAIQEHLRFLDPSNKRVHARAAESIYLLRAADCPAVLVECGFLSNDEEANRLCDDGYRKSIAAAIACAFTAAGIYG